MKRILNTDNLEWRKYLVKSHSGVERDIVKECTSVASQENADDHEHDLLLQASLYISFLRKEIIDIKEELAK